MLRYIDYNRDGELSIKISMAKSSKVKPIKIINGDVSYYLQNNQTIAVAKDPSTNALKIVDKLHKQQIKELVNNNQSAFLTFGMIEYAHRFIAQDTVLFAMMKALVQNPQSRIQVDEAKS